MRYLDAQQLGPGARARTDRGEVGEVIDAADTGISVLFRLRRDDGRVLDMHSSHLWPEVELTDRAPSGRATNRSGDAAADAGCR